MLKAKCSKCGYEFEFDPTPQKIPANETAKFAEDVLKSWSVLVVCAKCGHRKIVEIGEDDES